MHATESLAMPPVTRLPRPAVIGHRGAPSYRPEHTTAGYELAIDQGADLIEPDVVVSRDGVLVVRHESELSLSTDVADHAEFADRRTTREVHGRPVTGWFTEDFTLAELRTLRAVERMPALRPLNTAFDGRFGILTLAEVIELARRRSTPERTVQVLVELKTLTWPDDDGPSLAELTAGELRRLGVADPEGPVLVQTFDPRLLRELRTRLGEQCPRLIQLIADLPGFDPMVTRAGLREISTYAQGIAPSRERILADAGTTGGVRSPLVDDAHRAALSVFCWTLRAENAFLPEELRRGSEPGALGDAFAEARQLLDLGLDGLITDSPDHAVTALRTRARVRTRQAAVA
ncbi:glycerophosphodiester phosphodiesterase [Blastococcus sp. TML/M2B]|uniref:glycerophosphodiester phosphodiesterase family protein n=1 Tax=Blastococcus sp. TML/M2B TaxID=2798727 RepID=UPI0019097718|nr:glycerophosphodiester phosphodiesterase family protein [Blastococcus sp. TML/M2B]MBN1094195.1 glycerophosphodiester phosphodiesterase [Blastococcus sp. TML/M2B]